MRRLAPLLVILAACSTTGGDATTTAPLAEPSTTSITTSSTTTTTETPATTSSEDCVVQDGVLRNPRGFVCPPHLVNGTVIRSQEGEQLYLPGTYRTRQFLTPLRFTRTEQFNSIGEMNLWMEMDLEGQGRRYVEAWAGDLAHELARLPDRSCRDLPPDRWQADRTTRGTSVGGATGSHVEFSTRFEEICWFPIEGLPAGWETWEGWRVAIDVVSVSGSPVTFISTAPERVFDTYWAEVAQPILDSIEFIDLPEMTASSRSRGA